MKKLLAFILTLVMVASTFTMLPLSVSADTTTPELLTTAEEPPVADNTKDKGTSTNPYLVSKAEHLIWMAKQHAQTLEGYSFTYGGTGLPATGSNYGEVEIPNGDGATYGNPFDGKYFVQTKNIDLGGKIILSIGCFNGASEEFVNLNTTNKKYSVFGGNYDGCGYSISNGYILNQNPAETAITNTDLVCYYYGTGLFGVISGTTIANVNLKNVDLYTNADTQLATVGLLVGMAVAPTSSSTDNDTVNKILNCTTDSECSLVAECTSGGQTSSNTSNARFHQWGGIVGSAYRTLISGCENNANISVNNTVSCVGGIVGQYLAGDVVNCVNNGNITVTNEATERIQRNWRAFGGIVGIIPYNEKDVGLIPTNIKNCANYGTISNESDATVKYACGGILGGARKVLGGEKLTLENCYNFGQITMTAAEEVPFSASAIVGIIEFNADSTDTVAAKGQLVVNFKNLKSINLTSPAYNEFFQNYYTETIESTVMWSGCLQTTKGAEIAYSTQFIKDTNCAVSTDTAKLAKEADMVAACDLGIQAHSTDAGKYRFFATIDGLNWDEAGFNITVNNGNKSVTKEFFVTVAYNSIEENDVTVTDINGRKFIVLVLENVEADWTFEINAYVEDSTGTYPTTTWTGEFG